MKKILLLSALILFSCSKDSEEEASVAPGDEIIGTHQIVSNPDNELIKSEWSVGDYIHSGSITFSSNKKGFYDILRGTGAENTRVRRNFDWSYDGARWNLTEESLGQWIITFFDFYTMTVDNANRIGLPRTGKFFFK